LQSLAGYRRALSGFVRALPEWLATSPAEVDASQAQGMTAIEGGLA
jgi:hypothetical protein